MRLPAAEKALLQTLAVLGKTFAWSLLAVWWRSPRRSCWAAAHLRAAEFLYEQPAFPESEYTFKHALTQEWRTPRCSASGASAARTHSAGDRDALCGPPGRALRGFGPSLQPQRNTRRQWTTCSARATGGTAVRAGGGGHPPDGGLDLLQTLPESPSGFSRHWAAPQPGVDLEHGQGGRASPEVQQAYSRAYALCQQVGETPQRSRRCGLCFSR